jgi:hypothetical protein
MRHLTAGDEGEARMPWKVEQILQPGAGHFLRDGGGRRARVERRILIPDGCKPIRRDRRRQRAAEHPAEKSTASRTEKSRRGIADEFVKNLVRRNPALGQRLSKPRTQFRDVDRRRDRRVVEIFEIGLGVPKRARKNVGPG